MVQTEFSLGGPPGEGSLGAAAEVSERGPREDAQPPAGKRWLTTIRSVRIATARYWNKNIASSGLVPVRITRFPPRFLKYKVQAVIDLAPTKALLDVSKEAKGRAAFEKGFQAQLDALDVEGLGQKLADVTMLAGHTPNRGMVLLCFEDLRKGGGIYCHRTMVARWLEKVFEIKVEELPE